MGLRMTFDWQSFLEQHGIDYVTSGPNVGRGELGIRCPFCGPADSSQHMSISPEGHGWLCRRNRAEHKGKSPIRLIRALIGCSAEQARQILGVSVLPGDGGVLSAVEALLTPAAIQTPVRAALREPSEFKKFAGLPSSVPFVRYMEKRGFGKKFLARASAEMGLRYCARGPFGGRVIFLVHADGDLATWTGRSISSNARLRYKALSPDPEVAAEAGLPAAACSIEQCLLWRDDLMRGGETLHLVEGPADALKLRMLGAQATCLFTNTVSRGQVDQLRELAPRFKKCVLLLDKGAEAQAMRVSSDLTSLGFKMAWLPRGVDDPGELTPGLLEKISY